MALRQIAEKNQAEAQAMLIQANRIASVAEMAGAMCHELNNPLTGILGTAEILTEATDPSEVQSLAQVILQCAHRMREVVGHLRNYSRHDGQVDLKPVPIQNILQQTLVILNSQLSAAAIDVKINSSESHLVHGDPILISSLFGNLLANSRDAFYALTDNRRREISIDVTCKHGKIQISYQDNAGGMPKEVLARIFEPYFTTKEEGKGTGLGMAIVAGIVRQHGGSITVSSEQPHGTRFEIAFPAVRGEHRMQAAS
jgi:signal transduction histidine kinase